MKQEKKSERNGTNPIFCYIFNPLKNRIIDQVNKYYTCYIIFKEDKKKRVKKWVKHGSENGKTGKENALKSLLTHCELGGYELGQSGERGIRNVVCRLSISD